MEIDDIQKLVDYIKEDIENIRWNDNYWKCNTLSDILIDPCNVLWIKDEDLKKCKEIKKKYLDLMWDLIRDFKAKIDHYNFKLSDISTSLSKYYQEEDK
jgi:hypothetical protein